MKPIIIKLVTFLLITISATAVANETYSISDLNVIAYHNIIEDSEKSVDKFSITKSEFAKELAWIHDNGFTVISVDQYLAAKKGITPLPARPIMLTFDDGYLSTYTIAYPLLKEYHYTGVLAVIGSWIDAPTTATKILTWDQVSELSNSGVFEIASHSYDAHKGITGNPQNNEQPALSTHAYNPLTLSYESDIEYLSRVRADLQKNNEVLKSHTGKYPRIIVWPYGSYTEESEKLASSLGLVTSVALEDPEVRHQGGALSRILISNDVTIQSLSEQLTHIRKEDPIRLVHADLDYIYDKDPIQTEKNLSVLLDRLKEVGANTVFLQAFSDDTGSGRVSSVYFPSKNMPMKADLFNRVAWQIQTRTGAAVYAWMPILSFDFKDLSEDEYVKASDPSKVNSYHRISPFSKKGVDLINSVYEDLSRHSSISGIIFHDDGVLNDFEDFSPAAKLAYKENGLPTYVDDIKASRLLFEKWSSLKEEKVYAITDRLTETVAKWQRHTLKTARNMYAPVVYNPYAYEWTGQSYRGFSTHYNYVAVMAMPYMENIKTSHIEWLTQLASKSIPKNAIFELQSVDWNTGVPIPAEELNAQIRALVQAGISNIGYYPDNFVTGYPNIAAIKKEFSSRTTIDKDVSK